MQQGTGGCFLTLSLWKRTGRGFRNVAILLNGPPSHEEISHRPAACLRRNNHVVEEILGCEPVEGTVRKDIEHNWLLQPVLTINENVEYQVHRGTHPITNE